MNPNMTIMRFIALMTVAAASTLLAKISFQAETSETFLNYQMASGQFAQGTALAVDATGNVYSGGTTSDGAGVLTDHAHGLVRKSDMAEVNGFLSDDPTPLPSQYSSRVWRGLGNSRTTKRERANRPTT